MVGAGGARGGSATEPFQHKLGPGEPLRPSPHMRDTCGCANREAQTAFGYLVCRPPGAGLLSLQDGDKCISLFIHDLA